MLMSQVFVEELRACVCIIHYKGNNCGAIIFNMYIEDTNLNFKYIESASVAPLHFMHGLHLNQRLSLHVTHAWF